MKIAVIGGGNGAFAAAADLGEQGHSISYWRRDAERLSQLQSAGGLTLEDSVSRRFVPIDRITADIGDAVADAELIVIPLPATAQIDIADRLAGHLTDGQVLFLCPGSFGSYLMAVRLIERGERAQIAIAESGTLPYLTRKTDETEIAIITRATRLPSGVFPAVLNEHAFSVLQAAYPAVERLQDGLDGALMNAGPIIHPPLILMNAGPIQHFDHWDIHNEGTQPAIRSVTDCLDAERIALREALEYGGPHFPLADHYDDAREEWMYGNAAHDQLVVSEAWREPLNFQHHRYMTEDVACGLAFLVSVGEYANVPTPVGSGLLAIASAINGTDYRKAGRVIEKTDLASLNKEQLRRVLRKGLLK